MKNSTTTYLLSILLVLLVRLGFAETPCQPTLRNALFDSITINQQQGPFVVGPQNPYEFEIYLNPANFAGPYYTRAWLDVNQNDVFEAGELIMDHGPDSNLSFLEVVSLPPITPGVDYKIRFAISEVADFGPCDASIHDFRDSSLRRNDPFTVSANDSSCPCGYNPQNGLIPICVELGRSVEGEIIYEVPFDTLPEKTLSVRLTVSAEDPFGNKTYIQAQNQLEDWVKVVNINQGTVYPITFDVPFHLYSGNTTDTIQMNQYNIYFKLTALVDDKEGNDDDSGTLFRSRALVYDHVAADTVYIPLCDDLTRDEEDPEFVWSPYPNPVTDRLSIQSDPDVDEPYQLFDHQGMLIKEGTTSEAHIDMTLLKKGLYLLVIRKNKHLISKQ
ncbi:MAG: T9SS type A sorting domain-containing protein [Bacteroidota bacterium]